MRAMPCVACHACCAFSQCPCWHLFWGSRGLCPPGQQLLFRAHEKSLGARVARRGHLLPRASGVRSSRPSIRGLLPAATVLQ